MAVAITADEQSSWPPRVLLSVTGLTIGDDIELYRVVGGERTPVRGGIGVDVADTSFLRIDAEFPFGEPVTYLAVVDGVEYTVGPATYTLPGGRVAVSDAVSGLSAEVAILTWPARGWRRQASTFAVGARTVAVLGAMGQWEAVIELLTTTTGDRDQLENLLRGATGGTIQIRQPGGYDGIDCYIAVLDADERRVSRPARDLRRAWVLRVVQVEGWAPALEATGYTLQDIADAYDGLTLDDLSDDYVTLLDLAQGEFA